MRALTSSDLLQIWERTAGEAPALRPLRVLAQALPEVAAEEFPGWSLGRRDASLWAVRESLFGGEVLARAACGHCGRELELTLQTADLRRGLAEAAPVPRQLELAGFAIELRLPDSSDLLAAAGCADQAAARERITRRCVLAARTTDGRAVPSDTLPTGLVDGIAAHFAELAAGEESLLLAACPDCGTETAVAIDAAEFVLAEITAAAARLFDDIHRLARGYGWTEAEILALPPLRRRAYVELLCG